LWLRPRADARLTFALLTSASASVKGRDDGAGALVLLGAVGGGILGGIAAYALSEESSHRAPVTALGLAIPYLITLAITFD